MERTTNLSLKKPGLDDDALISDLNENFDKLDSKVGPVGNTSLQSQITAQSNNITKVQNGLAYIVGDTNTTGISLAVGAFVYVKGHATIPEGLRKVTANISANGSITTNNTEASTEGGLNALNSIITTVESTTVETELSYATGNVEFSKIGKFVQVRIFITITNPSSSAANVITIPQKYRPISNIQFTGYQEDGNGKSTVSYLARPDGAFYIYPESKSGDVYYRGTVMYIGNV